MPGAHAEVLVLEDDPEQRARLGEAVSATGLVPLLAEHPRKALAMLDVHRPVLAVVDLDMSKAEQTGRTAEEVLASLYERHGVCTPIVYSVNVGGVEQRDRIAGIHAYALVQDKRDGEEALLRRMRRLLKARFGDVAIDGGAIRHLPSGRVFSHRVGVSLVLARRANLEVALDDSEARAARRFQRWLREQVGSTVRVRPYRNRHYELELADGEGPSAPRGGPNQGAEVLVLEDDPDERLQVEGVVGQLQLTPLLAGDPGLALKLLERHRPVMAILDLNMSKAPETGRTVAEVLGELYERHGGCIPIVYSANVGHVETRDWIAAQHAFALVQDKRDGEAGLRERIGRLLRARFGDLHISGGRVRHEPTGKDFSHRVAVALLVATRAESSDVVLDESEGRAARRFERWLRDEVASVVTVRHQRNHYELAMLPPPSHPTKSAPPHRDFVGAPGSRGRVGEGGNAATGGSFPHRAGTVGPPPRSGGLDPHRAGGPARAGAEDGLVPHRAGCPARAGAEDGLVPHRAGCPASSPRSGGLVPHRAGCPASHPGPPPRGGREFDAARPG